MKLQILLDGADVTHITGDRNPKINGVVSDHRKVKSGNAFVCYQGLKVDGHSFIPGAVKNGAKVIISEKNIPDLSKDITTVVTPNGRKTQAICAANWHGNPAKKLSFTGITGTNGKTSTAHLSYGILKEQGLKTALLGTIGHIFDIQDPDNEDQKKVEIPALLTTPDPYELHAILRRFVDAGIEYVIMETSSQGLAQHRLTGINFDTAVFTNLTQDHLDYHENMDNYFAAKLMLFQQLDPKGLAILNADSPFTKRFTENIPYSNTLTYGLANGLANGLDSVADLSALDVNITLKRLSFTALNRRQLSFNDAPSWTKIDATLRMLGAYNVYNALAAIGVGLRYSCNPEAIKKGLASTVVPGRFENISLNGYQNNDIAVIVDYAHTPDGLENVLTAAKDIADRQLISVFGCGGDRDKGKRPKMGRISTLIADMSMITSDNPRTENPDEIINEIVSLLPPDAAFQCITDRRDAIKHAILNAREGDVIVIAGKGHEDYQEIHGERYPFDDREVAAQILHEVAKDTHELVSE